VRVTDVVEIVTVPATPDNGVGIRNTGVEIVDEEVKLRPLVTRKTRRASIL
jgi:hypothetical protein